MIHRVHLGITNPHGSYEVIPFYIEGADYADVLQRVRLLVKSIGDVDSQVMEITTEEWSF